MEEALTLGLDHKIPHTIQETAEQLLLALLGSLPRD